MTLVLWATWLALFLTALAATLSALSHAWRPANRWARALPAWALGAVLVPLALLLVAFLRGDLSVFYVWENVQTDYPWWLRLAGLWGGQAGTFLLWSGVILAATVVQSRRDTGPHWGRVRTVLLVLATVLLVAPVALHLGAETARFGLTVEGGFQMDASGPSPTNLRPSGDGLNPLLESPYMSIHPLVEFIAYGLAAIPFAYGLVHLFTGARFRQATRPWARGAWLAFLIALALGARWAYEVLSFGGYWIWDPVEVGNLLPFLALTVYLHADPVHRRGWLRLLTPAAAVLPFVLVVFASFVTRTGLWSSVHAFLPAGASVTVEDPMRRLLIGIQADFQPAFATRLFSLALGALSAATAVYHAREAPGDGEQRTWIGLGIGYASLGLAGAAFPGPVVQALGWAAGGLALGNPLVGVSLLVAIAAAPLAYGLWRSPEDTPVSPRTRGGQLTLAAALLALTALATGLLLVLGVNGYRANVFWARAPFLAAAILALVGLAFHPAAYHTRLLTIGGGLLLGALLGLVTASWAWASLPLVLAVAGSAGILAVRRAASVGSRASRWRVGLLMAAGVLGLIQWTSPGAITAGGVTVSSPARYVPIGLIASIGALAMPLIEARRGPSRWVGPIAGILAVGYGVGALFALAALVASPEGTGARTRVQVAGVPWIHVGLALLVAGVAASTYASSLWAFDQGDPLVRGEPQQIGMHTIELVDGNVVDADEDGRPEIVEANVHVRQGDTFVSEQTLRLQFSDSTGFTGRGSLVPDDSPIVRWWWGDVTLNADTSTPLAMRVDEPGANATWVVANGPPPQQLEGRVEAVSLGVERLPAVNLVWGSVTLIAVGFVARTSPWRR